MAAFFCATIKRFALFLCISVLTPLAASAASAPPPAADADYAAADAALKRNDIESGLRLMQQACDKRSTEACSRLAFLYSSAIFGSEIPQDNARAALLYAKGCDLGRLQSCTILGDFYSDGIGLVQDKTPAAEIYKKTCDKGDMSSCFYLAILYNNGEGVHKDDVQSDFYFRKGCEVKDTKCIDSVNMHKNGEIASKNKINHIGDYEGECVVSWNLRSCLILAFLYKNGEYTSNNNNFLDRLRNKTCNALAKLGCKTFSFIDEKSKISPQERTDIALLYKNFCDSGDISGCLILGLIYEKGEGVARDKARAATLYTNACESGNFDGCSYLGTLYENGEGVPQDKARGTALYTKACNGGASDGCDNLAINYLRGTVLPKDVPQAIILQDKACNGGNPRSCIRLGVTFDVGDSDGVSQDKVRAVSYYTKACNIGHLFGCRILLDAGSKIDPKQTILLKNKIDQLEAELVNWRKI